LEVRVASGGVWAKAAIGARSEMGRSKEPAAKVRRDVFKFDLVRRFWQKSGWMLWGTDADV